MSRENELQSASKWLFGRVTHHALRVRCAGLSNADLKRKLDELTERIRLLRRDVDEAVLESKKRAALAEITGLMNGMLESFGVEDPHDPVVLNIKELTLQIERIGRKDYLWEVGSASNWLGYHLGVDQLKMDYPQLKGDYEGTMADKVVIDAIIEGEAFHAERTVADLFENPMQG
jgi:hypothetical protein